MINYETVDAKQDPFGSLVCKYCKDKYCVYTRPNGEQVYCTDFISCAYNGPTDTYKVRCFGFEEDCNE